MNTSIKLVWFTLESQSVRLFVKNVNCQCSSTRQCKHKTTYPGEPWVGKCSPYWPYTSNGPGINQTVPDSLPWYLSILSHSLHIPVKLNEFMQYVIWLINIKHKCGDVLDYAFMQAYHPISSRSQGQIFIFLKGALGGKISSGV